MTNHQYVALLGDANVDIVLEIDQVPRAGADALATSQVVGVGGSAANTAIVLRRLGANAQLICCLGTDLWSEMSLKALRSEDISLTGFQRSIAFPTSINVVAVTPDHERTMFAYRGASAQLSADQLDEDVIAGAAVLYLSGYALLVEPQRDAAERAIKIAEAADVPIVLDVPVPAAHEARDQLLKFASRLKLLVIGLKEAQVLTGETGAQACFDALVALGTESVALKLGEKGAIVGSWDQQIEVAGINVDSRDTTGAGDSFVAAMIYGLLRKWDTFRTAHLANACGAAATQTRGAGRALPSREELEELVVRHEG